MAVVFDLDGTLIDSRGDIIASMNHALLKRGRNPLPGQVIVSYVGDGARALCARAARLPESHEEVDALLNGFLDYYQRHPIDFTRWMPGAHEVLDALAAMPDMKLAICTNKPRATTDAVLGALGVRTRFRATVAGGDVVERKPAPGPLLEVGRLLGVAEKSMIMVGDGPQDIECARRAGIRAIAVVGFRPRERLMEARPDVLLGHLSELPGVVQRWRESTARNRTIPPR
jgi:phosphoglycolate phosphatase